MIPGSFKLLLARGSILRRHPFVYEISVTADEAIRMTHETPWVVSVGGEVILVTIAPIDTGREKTREIWQMMADECRTNESFLISRIKSRR